MRPMNPAAKYALPIPPIGYTDKSATQSVSPRLPLNLPGEFQQ